MKNLIRDLRTKAGLSQSALGERVGVQKAAVSKWELGQTRPDRTTTVKIARALNADPKPLLDALEAAELGAEEPSEVRAGPEPARPVAIASWPRDIPVYGTVVGGTTGDFQMNGEIVDYVRRPPLLLNARYVFGVYVVSDSMFPRFKPGVPVLVNPTRPPAPGDDVIVELHPARGDTAGPAFVKHFLRRTPSAWVCKQWNPEKEIEYPAERVLRVLRIIPPEEMILV
jgi:phage repressor protein C with HTH and peptisase S24 domain